MAGSWFFMEVMEVWDAPQTGHRPRRLGAGSHHRHRRRGGSRRQAPGARRLPPDRRAGYDARAAARANRPAWAAYEFDRSTDRCTSSPDNPFGFPIAKSCARHGFGHRNYEADGTFSADKARLDSALHEDLERVCTNYGGATKTACTSTAWTYHQAVRAFG